MVTVNRKLSYGSIAAEWKLSLEVLVFLMLFSLVGYIFYNYYFKQYFSETIVYRQEEMLKLKLSKSEIVFLGDSRSLLGLNSDLIAGSLNYASPAEGYVQSYYKLKRLLKIKPDVKTVVLQYDWESLVREHREYDHLYFWRDLIDATELDSQAHTLIYYQLVYKILGTIAPYTANAATFFHSENNKKKPWYGITFSPASDHIRLNEEKLLLETVDNFKKTSGKVHINRLVTKYFFKTLDLLNQQNINIYLVSLPLNKYYYQRIEPMMDVQAYEETLETAMKNYHVIKFIDYSKLLDTSPCLGYDCKNFCDFDHVDTDGSDMISRLLVRDLLR